MKRFKVIWTKNAELDLELIIEYIKINSIEIAKKIFIEIFFNSLNVLCNEFFTGSMKILLSFSVDK